ncbi:hypothetical protein [Candidatus Chloroploca asiatica]|uniref:Uncharacterized protein n=1 Tax=Candidatus Chloroploca asiatica TaxID=1506545 RepID=A0A2H3KPW9_9CHLR|nr:hypothetical protein [Candidatus Chloroploca asiatica]PDW00343.1 hypothetical protein A9Q02_10110 [Candidatus Chloroploca asiatica]
MSEYQYYEFQAVDRPLTAEQKAAMRKLSSRVELSATQAVFNYAYSNFRGEPLKVLEQHFDALLYIANWGSKQLAFRFPKNALDPEQLQPYLLDAEESCSAQVAVTATHVLLNLKLNEEEGYGWIEGEGLLDPLIPLREALLQGDLRALYLYWLRAANERAGWVMEEEEDEEDEDDNVAEPLVEPPVPAGLGQLDEALQALVEFFEIDRDLIAAAAEQSPALTANEEPLAAWIPLLPEEERNAFLLRVVQGEAHVGVALCRRLREVGRASSMAVRIGPQRTFAELQAIAEVQRSRRIQREREAAAQARLARLDALAQREDALWEQIAILLAKRTASSYEESVGYLVELRELAIHQQKRAAFDAKLADVIAPYAKSTALQRRLQEKRLLPSP